MTTDNEITALTLPVASQLRTDLQAIAQFQAIVKHELKEGHDYGVIPGTQKPTLLKPGAEKVAKLLGLADHYEIVDSQEDWDKPFFRYLIRTRLVSVRTGVTVSEGLGECNSMEARYRWRWAWPRDLPAGEDTSKLVSRTVSNGGKQYRLPNDDLYSLVNTILKMAKKRALVDAALSAARLSDLFTQDMEDLRTEETSTMVSEREDAKTRAVAPSATRRATKTQTASDSPKAVEDTPPSRVGALMGKRDEFAQAYADAWGWDLQKPMTTAQRDDLAQVMRIWIGMTFKRNDPDTPNELAFDSLSEQEQETAIGMLKAQARGATQKKERETTLEQEEQETMF